jgi:hypothetical protein
MDNTGNDIVAGKGDAALPRRVRACEFCKRPLTNDNTRCWQWECVPATIADLRDTIEECGRKLQVQKIRNREQRIGIDELRADIATLRAERDELRIDLRRALAWLDTERLDPSERLWVERRKQALDA